MTDQGDHIPIGYVRKAHGIRGDVLVRGLVSDARDRFVDGATLATAPPHQQSYTVEGAAPHRGDIILTLRGVLTRNDAEALVGIQFVVPFSQRRTLEDGEWWAEDLVGCAVVDLDGGGLGTVTDVITGAAQDRLAVTRPDGVVGEVPLVDALVHTVDVEARRIVVDLPEGLFG